MFNDKDTHSEEILKTPPEFFTKVSTPSIGISFPVEKFSKEGVSAVKSETGNFAKWLKAKNPELKIEMPTKEPKLILRNSDYWMPLAFLGSDIGLPIYLNMVSSYIYDCVKNGLLKGETTNVHVETVYTDKKQGVVKKFKYSGSLTGLQSLTAKMDGFFEK